MKQYNNEKAIISLTSWKKRIETTDKTIFSLIKNCPGFHIVLVLSEDEFPAKEAELPNNLFLFLNNNLIELLWVKQNYKSFKKVLFTIDKYPTVPIISADDGCTFIRNYAEDLYQCWLKYPKAIISEVVHKCNGITGGGGSQGILYPPNCFNGYGSKILNLKYNELIQNSNDDRFNGCLASIFKIKWLHAKTIRHNKRAYTNAIPFKNDKNGMTKNKLYKQGTNWKFISIIKNALKILK